MSAADDLEVRRQVQAMIGQVQAALRSVPTIAYGTVTETSPIEVQVDGHSTSIKPSATLASYSAPAKGDRVRMDYFRNEYVVVGKL